MTLSEVRTDAQTGGFNPTTDAYAHELIAKGALATADGEPCVRARGFGR